ncbi:hypothetical protein C8Q80DRAFT_476013 [Daedaleopsis nitida]|nr:hypothetical protein C8Q80DRAFT_476013 [Daedaleopsis nitida]
MSRNVICLPKARRFAVAQMDPVEMVKHLNDPDAVLAAQEMQTQKYLVYLEYPEDFPLPDSQWCRYRVNPVATTLRPVVPGKGITPDMAIPIYPNKNLARSDTLISPKPSFPFHNCYFWIESRTSLRVRVNRERTYDNDKAYQLDIPQHIALSDGFEKEFSRMRDALTNLRHDSADSRRRPTAALASAALSHYLSHDAGFESALTDDSDATSDADSDSCADSDTSSTPTIPPSLAGLLKLNLFGWDHDPSFRYIPLVDIWLDIDSHLSASKIPSPVDLWREQQDIAQ